MEFEVHVSRMEPAPGHWRAYIARQKEPRFVADGQSAEEAAQILCSDGVLISPRRMDSQHCVFTAKYDDAQIPRWFVPTRCGGSLD